MTKSDILPLKWSEAAARNPMIPDDIYDPEFVRKLFDEMSGTYERVNYLTSFGFSHRWRRQFIAQANIQPDSTVCDLMCGMGECWFAIGSAPTITSLLGIDISPGMLHYAQLHAARFPDLQITLEEQNALQTNLESESVDCIISGFGLKTFSDQQQRQLAAEMVRILKPNGSFALIEVSVPRLQLLRIPYLFYLKKVVSIFGRLLLGNPDNYRMLGIYTERFGNCLPMKQILTDAGFSVSYDSYFFGCATGISGFKRSKPHIKPELKWK